MHTFILLLLGFIAGALSMGWLCWTLVHRKIEDLETSLHDQFIGLRKVLDTMRSPAPPATLSALNSQSAAPNSPPA